MNVPLRVWTEEENKKVIYFVWARGVLGPEIHHRLSVQYGDFFNTIFISGFKYGWTSIGYKTDFGLNLLGFMWDRFLIHPRINSTLV